MRRAMEEGLRWEAPLTGIALENIRADGATGNMLVDVFVTPKQTLTAPNGGETLIDTEPYTIQWAVRPPPLWPIKYFRAHGSPISCAGV